MIAFPHHVFHIVIIDDEDSELKLMHEAFTETKLSFEIETFNTGNAAIVHLQVMPLVDLIICDTHMPTFSGWDVLALLSSDHKLWSTPIVMTSCQTVSRLPFRMFQRHEVPFFTKSTTWDAHLSTARNIHAALHAGWDHTQAQKYIGHLRLLTF